MSLGETANIPGAWGLPRGGMGTISGRLAARYRYLGGELHTRAEVVRVEPQEDGGFAVLLQDGEYLKARAVVISTSLDQLGILTGGEITVESETIGGTSATLHIELNDVPAVHSDLKPWLSERLSRGQPVLLGSGPESLEKLDYSIDRVGEEPDGFSRPLLLSSSFFWDGPRPVLFVYSQFVGNSCVKARLVEECVGQLTECFFPDLASRINSVVALTPADIETRLGSPLGHPEHNQMFFPDLIWCRPSRTLAEYRTRWRGLYHGSASSYPGGLVTGIPGRNVAKVLLRDFESA